MCNYKALPYKKTIQFFFKSLLIKTILHWRPLLLITSTGKDNLILLVNSWEILKNVSSQYYFFIKECISVSFFLVSLWAVPLYCPFSQIPTQTSWKGMLKWEIKYLPRACCIWSTFINLDIHYPVHILKTYVYTFYKLF